MKETISKEGIFLNWFQYILLAVIAIASGYFLACNVEVPKEDTNSIVAASGIIEEPYAELLEYIWFRESRCGLDKAYLEPQPNGEVGQYQITPIFHADVERLGYDITMIDNQSCRYGITIWLDHYSKLLPEWDSYSLEEQYELYRRGYSGFKKWKKK